MDRLLAVYDRLDEFEHQQRLRIKAALEGMTEASLESEWTFFRSKRNQYIGEPSLTTPKCSCSKEAYMTLPELPAIFRRMRESTAENRCKKS